MLPIIKEAMPKALRIDTLNDQSVFMEDSVVGAAGSRLATLLTGLLVLLFRRLAHHPLMIVITIPLATLCSVIALSATGQTINVMTLGGLALAVAGMLVDRQPSRWKTTATILNKGRTSSPRSSIARSRS